MLYQVANYPGVAEQIRLLVDHAGFAGIRGIVSDAFKEMVLHLQTHPLDWGDPDYTLNTPGGVVYHAVLDPIIVRYVVFDARKIVFVKEVKPLPGLPFDRQ